MMLSSCPTCGKPVALLGFTLTYPGPPGYCQCPTVPVRLLTTNTTEQELHQEEVPQAFYDAFGDKELEP